MSSFSILLMLILAHLLVPSLLFAQLPVIENLDTRNPLVAQIADDIQRFYQWQAGNGRPPNLQLYRYRVRTNDTLFSLAARINLPQASLATLNRIDRPSLPPAGSLVYIPNIPGIFLPSEPDSDFEKLIAARIEAAGETIEIQDFRIPGEDRENSFWRFVAAVDFTGLERRAFLQVLFLDPLPGGRISSRYGLRVSPFTGNTQFHYGLDLVAAEGSPVRSSLEGTVSQTGYDSLYGNYILVSHPGGYETRYAHLKEILIQTDDHIMAGQTIGTVGSTGLSTGSHLHFEILYEGFNRNPQDFIRKGE